MSAPTFAKGVRFRRTADGTGILLIPEGVVNLNPSAAAIVELIDGERSATAIAHVLCTQYAVDETDLLRDVEALLDDFAAKSWLSAQDSARMDAASKATN